MKTLSFLLLAVPLLAQVTPPVGQTITLTTTGTSGPSTLQGNVLNVPQYSGGTNATTINGAAVPASAPCLGSNSSSGPQLVAGCGLANGATSSVVGSGGLRDRINVKDFGASGRDTTSTTTATVASGATVIPLNSNCQENGYLHIYYFILILAAIIMHLLKNMLV